MLKPGVAWATAFLGTIRGRILIAFLFMSMITGALGGYAAMGMKQTGILVAKTFDESLMSINYARAAAADFAKGPNWLFTTPAAVSPRELRRKWRRSTGRLSG